jgi:CTP-dependent riboflavin kinase
MEILKGRVCREGEGAGAKDFTRRMTKYPGVFERATGEHLYPGTLNVNVGKPIRVKEHFRIHGKEISESEEFQFEVCRINGIWAYRVRPLDTNGRGGHGDDIIEIVCSQKIPNVSPETEVEIALFPRDSWTY